MSLNTLCAYLDKKKIAIWGLGREGRSSLNFIDRFQDMIRPAHIYLADQNAPTDETLCQWLDRPNVTGYFGDAQRAALDDADLVLMSPGIPVLDQDIHLRDGFYRFRDWPNLEVTGQMDLFLRHSPGHLFGVTGTKGKSTTTSVLAAMMKGAGLDSHLIGNIGIPVWEALPLMTDDSYAAIELSSHQLQFACGTPEVVIITNMFPEHLDHYTSYDAYLDAKLNTLRHQGLPMSTAQRNQRAPIYILNLASEELRDRATPLAIQVGAKIVTVTDAEHLNQDDSMADTSWQVRDQSLVNCANPEREVLDLGQNTRHLIGAHMRYDAAMAAAALIASGIEPAALNKGLKDFEGLPHRTQFVGQFHGIDFYDDSIATIPQATRLTTEALGARVQTLVLGGMDRGVDMTPLVDWLITTDIDTLLLLPDTGFTILQQLEQHRESDPSIKLKGIVTPSMKEVAQEAFKHTDKGRIVLLSPAASSYNKYKNFEERADVFAKAVRDEAAHISRVGGTDDAT